MDDLFKRGVVAYLGLTAAFWFMSLMMVYNGANYSCNPSWSLVVFLRNLFTGGLVVSAILFVRMGILNLIAEQRRFLEQEREAVKQKAVDFENHVRRLQEDEQRAVEKANVDHLREELRLKKIKENEVRKRVHRQSRSAKDATASSLDSFL